ncbi:MAG: hypothetical protein L0323_03265 [Planctomycetes bacterium]|nr:hypothetical protein [Planctomycetota bacterium]
MEPASHAARDEGKGPILSRLPLAFVENRGQWDTSSKFVARRGAMTARIEKDALVLQLTRREGDDRLDGVVVRLAFEGALETVALEGEGKQPGIYNFFLGNDPSKWRTEVPGYASVLVRGLQEGVDLRVREHEGRLEYDLILAPGADLARVVVRCEGTERLDVEPDGSLALKTALGPIRQSPPVTWQILAGGERRPIEARFRLLGPDRFGFEAPARDPSLALVIDPGLVFSTFLGGLVNDQVYDLDLDASGAATVAGATGSSGFPATPGAFDTGLDTFGDGFVTRLSQTGGSLLFSTYLGGSGGDVATSLALDPSGAATVTGHTDSLNFPTTTGAFDTSHSGQCPTFPTFPCPDVFVARLSPTGGSLVYSTLLGASGIDRAYALALDPSGTTTVTGETLASGFPTTPGAFGTTFLGGGPFSNDAFLARLSATGGSLLYSTFLGSPGSEFAVALGVDGSGAATVAGYTESAGFPTTAGAFDTSHNGGPSIPWDAFVARLSPSGASLAFSTFLGGTDVDEAHAVSLDASAGVTVAGRTFSPDFPTTAGAFDTTDGGSGDAYVTRLSPTGASLAYSTLLGGAGADIARAVALDASGGATVVGGTTGSGFPTTAGAADTTFNGPPIFSGDAFASRLTPSGDSLIYSTFLGGTAREIGIGLVLDPSGTATVAGTTLSSDFPTTSGAFDTSFNTPPGFAPLDDGFILSLDLLPTGASAYGASTPGCAGPLAIGVTSIPQVGNASFAITCTNAPANAFGFFGVSSAGLTTPLVFNGLAVWIDPFAPLFFEIVVPSDPVGAATVPIPIPANPALAGVQLFFQFAWFDACAPGGFSASNALAVVVQP